MALVSQITCKRCGAAAHVSHSPADAPPEVCGPCLGKEVATRRDQHLAAMAALPLADRVARIEAWIYDYRPPVPLSEMRF